MKIDVFFMVSPTSWLFRSSWEVVHGSTRMEKIQKRQKWSKTYPNYHRSSYKLAEKKIFRNNTWSVVPNRFHMGSTRTTVALMYPLDFWLILYGPQCGHVDTQSPYGSMNPDTRSHDFQCGKSCISVNTQNKLQISPHTNISAKNLTTSKDISSPKERKNKY